MSAKRPTKPSRDYSTMPRAEAERHFRVRELKLKDAIRTLPLAQKCRLVADFLDEGERVAPALVLGVARLALAELESRR